MTYLVESVVGSWGKAGWATSTARLKLVCIYDKIFDVLFVLCLIDGSNIDVKLST
jgi:hypothetical protein